MVLAQRVDRADRTGARRTFILIAVVDGLKGFPDATAYPAAIAQTSIVHLLRYSLHFASWKERKELARAFPKPIRRLIYTTNAIESLHSTVRRTIRNRGHFPNDQAAMKLIYLARQRAQAKWKRHPIVWQRPRLTSPFGSEIDLSSTNINQRGRRQTQNSVQARSWFVVRGSRSGVPCATFKT